MLFKNLVVNTFDGGADYSFDFDGISCQVNEVMSSVYNYVTELYFGDKYIRWGRENGEMFSVGDVESVVKNKKFVEAFVSYFDYCLPRQ